MRRSEILTWTDGLMKSFGPPRPAVEEAPLLEMYKEKNYGGMLNLIKKSMRLNMRLRVGYVSAGGHSAPAWVSLPSPMPFYGSEAFKKLTITVYIRRDTIANASFPILVSTMAHELSHVLLDAVGHDLRRKEEAVDLTAMIFGYGPFFTSEKPYVEYGERQDLLAKACKWLIGKRLMETVEYGVHREKSGYLSWDEITFAQNLMAALSAGSRLPRF